MSTPLSISACMIVRDEQAVLTECLTSVRPFVDEIVVVDTGSTDSTVAIAESFGAVVGHFEWCEDFSAARNAALDLATGDWILTIDADETFEADCRSVLARAAAEPGATSYAIEMVNKGFEAERGTCPRFFRAGARYDGRLHERPIGLPFDRVLAGARFVHVGYSQEVMEEKGKRVRNVRLAELELHERPDTGGSYVNLIRALGSEGGDRVRELAETGLRETERGDRDRPALYVYLATFYGEHGDTAAALKCFQRADSDGASSLWLDFMASATLLKTGRAAEAKPIIERCCQRPPLHHFDFLVEQDRGRLRRAVLAASAGPGVPKGMPRGAIPLD